MNIHKYKLAGGHHKYHVENTVASNLRSRADSKLISLTSNWTLSSNDKLTLRRARDLLRRTEDRLHRKQVEFKQRRKAMDQDWLDLSAKTREFRDLIQTSEDFVKTNEAKRERARENLEHSGHLQRVHAEQIDWLKTRIREMREVKSCMDVNVRSHRIYGEYFNTVLERSEFFKNRDDILEFYRDQVMTREKLGDRQNESLKEIEGAIHMTNRFCYNNRLTILGIHNQIVDLQTRYKEAQFHTRKWEHLVLDVQESIRKNCSDFELVKSAIDNLYRQMCQRKRVRVQCSDWEEQIRFIRRTIREMYIIRELWNDRKTSVWMKNG